MQRSAQQNDKCKLTTNTHASVPPHLAIPLAQRLIYISGLLPRGLAAALGTPTRLEHLDPALQQLLDLLLSPLLVLDLDALNHLSDLLLVVACLVRLAVPAQLQLFGRRLLESALDVWVFLEDLEVVFVGGEEAGEEGFDAEFEDDDGEEDDDEDEPPC